MNQTEEMKREDKIYKIEDISEIYYIDNDRKNHIWFKIDSAAPNMVSGKKFEARNLKERKVLKCIHIWRQELRLGRNSKFPELRRR